jgi:inorganic pyrophosphatase
MKGETLEKQLETRETVTALIEIPAGSRNKYEYNKETGKFYLDRVLYHSVHYPTDYGHIPDTLADDGDELDILVVVQEPTFPGCLIEAVPIGGLIMDDEKGSDFKVLAVPVHDPRYAHVQQVSDLGAHFLLEIEAFFSTYKLLEPKNTSVLGWEERAAAWDVIRQCWKNYADQGDPS